MINYLKDVFEHIESRQIIVPVYPCWDVSHNSACIIYAAYSISAANELYVNSETGPCPLRSNIVDDFYKLFNKLSDEESAFRMKQVLALSS